jgi:hypothetical protein
MRAIEVWREARGAAWRQRGPPALLPFLRELLYFPDLQDPHFS